MAIEGPILLRAAGISAFVAISFLMLSGISMALFVTGAGAFWGPVNDMATAVCLAALALPVIAIVHLVGDRTGLWFEVVSVGAIAGIALAASGQVLLVLGTIRLETSFVTGGLGILPVFAWLVAVAIVALGVGLLPSHVGWLALGVIAMSVGLGVASGMLGRPAVWLAAVALTIVLVSWVGSIGLLLLQRSASAS